MTADKDKEDEEEEEVEVEEAEEEEDAVEVRGAAFLAEVVESMRVAKS